MKPAGAVEAMSRCACHDVAFARIAEQMRAGGRSFEAVRRMLPCAETCTACLPDLTDFLRAEGLIESGSA